MQDLMQEVRNKRANIWESHRICGGDVGEIPPAFLQHTSVSHKDIEHKQDLSLPHNDAYKNRTYISLIYSVTYWTRELEQCPGRL